MKKSSISLLFAIFILPVLTAGNVNLKVISNHDWWWNAPEEPEVTIVAVNTSADITTSQIALDVATDKNLPVQNMTQSVTINPNDSVELKYSLTLAPGFYKCVATADGEEKQKFNIGFEPENIVSLPDSQSDFSEFWDNAKAELSGIAPCYQMTLEKDKSNKVREVYLVKMRSLGNEEIQGYLTIPVKKGKYPVIVYYMGYGSKPWHAHPDGNKDFVEFVLSSRGQGLNEPTNKYGDWIVSGMESKEGYYYRGAFMDLVRAIDFVTQLDKVDSRYVFAEGGSQGGAFTLAACALDHRITAGAPWIPFLSDYPDYFKLVHWPAEPVLKRQKELGMSDKELYVLMSYFDIKNFARWIECPIMMGVGLQDPVCPPHTNFSSYNLISSEKQFIIYPHCGHDVVHPDWENARMKFYQKFIHK